MNNRVLFVDDEPNILAGYKRQLRRQFAVETAPGGDQGLKEITHRGPYAVIVSDLRMPGMDGIELLSRVRGVAPDTVRMMLTGYADLQSAIEAVNQGNIFRLLTKPCPEEALVNALNSGIEQYRLIIAERELLEKTLLGSLKVLTELLAAVNPEAFGRAQRITRYVLKIGLRIGVSDLWQLETAAMLSQIGCVILPERIFKKTYQGRELSKEESELMKKHPTVGSELLSQIPRMEDVSEIIAYQQKRFNGGGTPEDSRRGEDIPLGARILKVVLDFDTLQVSGTRRRHVLASLKQKIGWYDPAVLAALEDMIQADETGYEMTTIPLDDLMEDMILAEDIQTRRGLLLVPKGNQISRPILERLNNYVSKSTIRQPIQVLVPVGGKGKSLPEGSW